MILQSLYDLYDRLEKDPTYEIARPGYSLQKITFRIVLTREGRLVAPVQDIRRSEGGKARPRPLIVPGGDKPTGKTTEATVARKVHLLRNDMPFVLGLKTEETAGLGRPEFKKLVPALWEFEAFRAFHTEIETEIHDPAFSAVCNFLRDWNPNDAAGDERYNYLIDLAGWQGVFILVGETEYVHDRQAVRKWWNSRIKKVWDQAPRRQCLVTGQWEPIAILHEPKIKHVAISSGAPIVAFDKDSPAFCSYGGDGQQGLNAPVSKQAAFKYATALNALLDGTMPAKHSFALGDATVAFWTARPTFTEDIFSCVVGESTAEDPLPSPTQPQQDEAIVKKLSIFLGALRSGKSVFEDVGDDPKTPFFLMGLTGQAKGRVGVRYFHQSTVGDLAEKLGRHFCDIAITPEPAKGKRAPDPEFPSAQLLLDQTCPPKKRKSNQTRTSLIWPPEPRECDRKLIPPILTGPFLRAIIQGTRYPAGLYSAVIRRIHADRVINYARACVIKGFLKRNLGKEVPMSLDVNRSDPAYRMGRLFAALEKTQLDALGRGLNATIRDRFYGAASATPRSVFPRLLRTYQHHLAKLEGGRKVNREKLMQEIMGPLTDFTPHLDLAGQGLFALGYYHQMQDFFTPRQEQATNDEKGADDESV